LKNEGKQDDKPKKSVMQRKNDCVEIVNLRVKIKFHAMQREIFPYNGITPKGKQLESRIKSRPDKRKETL